MKKGILLVGLAASALLVTGCNGGEGKTLNCTLEEKAGGTTTTSSVEMKFNSGNDKIEEAKMEISINYTEEYKSFADVFKQTLESQKTNLEDIGYEVTITSSDLSQKLTATGTSKTLDSSESTGSYEATKESFEDSGYTCE